jgi:hypothetical protein
VHPIDDEKQDEKQGGKGRKNNKKNGNQQEKITIINHVAGDSSKELAVPNEELSFRNLSVRITGIRRLHSYFDAPIIKFLNHFVINFYSNF